MEHDDLLSYFQSLLPEDFASRDDLAHIKFGPPVPPPSVDPSFNVSDLIRLLPLHPLDGFNPVRTEYYALLFCFSGVLSLHIDGVSMMLSAEQTLFLSPGHEFQADPCGANDYAVLLPMKDRVLTDHLSLYHLPLFAEYLDFSSSGKEMSPRQPWLIFQNQQCSGTQWYINELCCEHFDPDRRTILSVPHLLQMIFVGLDRCIDSSAKKRQVTSPLSIQTILRYMRTNYSSVSLQETADRFGFSPNYLSNLLKQYYGMSFRELKQRECLSQAARLLAETDLPVSQVAQTVGIRNATQFYKLFRARFGKTPAKYRASLKDTQP